MSHLRLQRSMLLTAAHIFSILLLTWASKQQPKKLLIHGSSVLRLRAAVLFEQLFCICCSECTCESGLSMWSTTSGVTAALWVIVGRRKGVKSVEEDLSRISSVCFGSVAAGARRRTGCPSLSSISHQRTFSWQSQCFVCVVYFPVYSFSQSVCVCVSQSLSLSQKVPVRTTSRSPVLSRRDSPHHHGNTPHSSHAVQRNAGR